MKKKILNSLHLVLSALVMLVVMLLIVILAFIGAIEKCVNEVSLKYLEDAIKNYCHPYVHKVYKEII